MLLDWIAAHPHASGAVVFLIAFSESLAIVGLFMPGAVLMFGLGALIALGHLAFLPTVAWAVAGAICGDGLSFWIGHHYRRELRSIWPFRNYPRLIERGIGFFRRHGGKSVLFGRFVGPVRPILPAVAGMLGMPVSRFVTINVLSAFAWAPAYLLPGMLFGASLELAAEVAGRLALVLLLLAALLWFTFVAVRALWRAGAPHAHAAIVRLHDWGREHPRFAAITSALGDPGGAEARGLAVLAVVLLGLAAALLGLELALFDYPGTLERTLHGLLVDLRTPPADAVLIAVTESADRLFLAIYAGLVAVGLFWSDPRAARHWLAAIAFAAVAPALLKLLFGMPRPEPFATVLGGSSYPSGHALAATVVYGFAAVLVANALPQAWRGLPYALAALLISAVAFSRAYLGVHWPGDVLAGMLLGLAWVVLLGTAYGIRAATAVSAGRMATLLVLPWLLVYPAYVPLKLGADLARYDAESAPESLTLAQWRTVPWDALARRAPEATTSGTAPRLAWAGDLEAVGDTLRAAGWRTPPAVEPWEWVRMLNPATPLQRLPPLPSVHDGRGAAATWLRDVAEGDARNVLRLWDSGLRLDGAPVWVGRLETERRARLLGLLAYARGDPAPAAVLAALVDDTEGAWPVRRTGDGALIGP